MCQQMKRATRSLVKPCGGDPGADVIFEGSSDAEAGPSGIPQKLENACAYRHFRVDQEETFGGFATSLMKRLRKRVKQANMVVVWLWRSSLAAAPLSLRIATQGLQLR